MSKFEEVQVKLEEVDRLIGELLDSEPEEKRGEYGKEISSMFQELNWIDFCCVTEKDK